MPNCSVCVFVYIRISPLPSSPPLHRPYVCSPTCMVTVLTVLLSCTVPVFLSVYLQFPSFHSVVLGKRRFACAKNGPNAYKTIIKPTNYVPTSVSNNNAQKPLRATTRTTSRSLSLYLLLHTTLSSNPPPSSTYANLFFHA